MVSRVLALSTSDAALLAALSLLSAANILAGARLLVPKQCRAALRQCRAVFCDFCKSMACVADAGADDKVRKVVEQRVEAKVERSMQVTWVILTWSLCFTGVTVCANILMKSSRWMSFGQTVVCAVGLFVLAAGNTCLSAVVAKKPSLVYCFVLVALSCNTFFVEANFISAFMTGALAFFARAVVSLRYHRIRVVLGLNIAYLVVASYTIAGAFPEVARILILCEAWVCFAVVMLSAGAARTLRSEVRREVEAAMLRCESSGLWELLDLVCDVVVPLDHELRISDSAPRFAALVMSQGRDIQGMHLRDFMPQEEDREALERCASLGTPSVAQGTAPRVLHVSLRDGLGNTVRVELFCVQVLTLVARSYFVGIREFSDYAPIAECRTFERKTRGGRSRRSARDAGGLLKEGKASGTLSAERPRPDHASTPSESGASDAGSSSGSEESSPSRSASTSGIGLDLGLADRRPTKMETSDVAVRLALVRLMRMCSEPPRRRAAASGSSGDRPGHPCCPYHRRVDFLSDSLRSLRDEPCVRKFRCKGVAQCSMCGLLVDEGPEHSRVKCFACLSVLQQCSKAQPKLTL